MSYDLKTLDQQYATKLAELRQLQIGVDHLLLLRELQEIAHKRIAHLSFSLVKPVLP